MFKYSIYQMNIVSLAPSNTEILYYLDKFENVDGITFLCEFPEETKNKQRVGGWTENIDFSKIEEINPDLIMTSDNLQREIRDELQDKGYNVCHTEPNSLNEVYKSIKMIGSKLKSEQRAKKIVRQMKEKVQKTDLEGAKIYCEEWHEPPMVSGNWIPDLINQANGNYFIEKGRSRETNLEELKDFNPGYIFLNICGAGKNAESSQVTERDNWQDIKAVKEGHVYVINDSLLNRPSPRLTQGLKKIEEKIN